MTIVLLGIISAIALPKYMNLSSNAKTAAVSGALGSIRSAINIQYTYNAAMGSATYPTTLLGTYFAEGVIPTNANNSLNTVSTTTTAGVGWHYYPATGTIEAGT